MPSTFLALIAPEKLSRSIVPSPYNTCAFERSSEHPVSKFLLSIILLLSTVILYPASVATPLTLLVALSEVATLSTVPSPEGRPVTNPCAITSVPILSELIPLISTAY